MRADEPLDAALDLLAGDQRTRDVALFRCAEDVLRCLESHYAPPTPPQRLDSFRGLSVEQLREQIRDKDGGATALGKLFGQYRNAVLTHEERCAARLNTLAGTARTLQRLEAITTDPERLRGMLDELSYFVSGRWGKDLSLDERDREWSLRVSRRYDLLPPAWRHA